jgi:2-keto-4-pentenoate hydratase
VSDVDPRLVAALHAQLGQQRALLAAGAERLGWKLGIGDRERIGDEVAVGYLTSATRLKPGATYTVHGAELLHADAEVALELGPDGSIVGYGVALELVDLASPPDNPAEVVIANVFHRAVSLGPSRPALPKDGVEARLIVNGEVRGAARSSAQLGDRVRAAARALESVGERLRAGDRIITGSIVQVPVTAGDEVVADLGYLGRVQLLIAP